MIYSVHIVSKLQCKLKINRKTEYLVVLLFLTEALILQLSSFLQLIGSNELLYNGIYATVVPITSRYWHCNCDWRLTFNSLTSNASVMREKNTQSCKLKCYCYLALFKYYSLTNMLSGSSEGWLLHKDQGSEADNTASTVGASCIIQN